MWWVINAEHEIVFSVDSVEEAKKIIEEDNWYIDYVWLNQ